MHIVQIATVEAVGNDYAGMRLLKAVLDSLGAEGSEQRLVHRAQAPGGEDGDKKLGSARHQTSHPVTWTHTLGFEHIGKTGRLRLELVETVPCCVAIAVFVD